MTDIWCVVHLKLCMCALNLFMQKNQGILLGVAGTDIPLQELMKLIPKHMVQSAAPAQVNLLKRFSFFNSSFVFSPFFFSSQVGNPWIRLRHHKQWLHPDAPRPQTSGNPVSHLVQRSLTLPSFFPFLSFRFVHGIVCITKMMN